MKLFLQLIWVLILILSMIFSYYSAWNHNILGIVISFIPTIGGFFYSLGKDLNK